MKSYEDELNALYDKKLMAKTDALEAEHKGNVEAIKSERAGIDAQYAMAQNAAAATAERDRRSFNTSALASGLNAGAASQAQLAMGVAARNNAASLEEKRLNAHAASAQREAEAESSYKQKIASAIGENDYERAKALYEEYKRSGSAAESEAKLMAAYGDFSGYADLYGEETAQAMRQIWIAKNPLLARNMGIIDQAEYKRLIKK